MATQWSTRIAKLLGWIYKIPTKIYVSARIRRATCFCPPATEVYNERRRNQLFRFAQTGETIQLRRARESRFGNCRKNKGKSMHRREADDKFRSVRGRGTCRSLLASSQHTTHCNGRISYVNLYSLLYTSRFRIITWSERSMVKFTWTRTWKWT